MVKFSLQFLGTGNASAKPPINFHTNALISSQGRHWLIDCGYLCPLALHQAAIDPTSLEGIFISHLHGDHVFGLEEILFQFYFSARKRASLWLPEMLFSENSKIPGSDIWENCLRASLETIDLGCIPPKSITFEDYADIHKMHEGDSYNITGIPVQLLKVDHVPNRPCFGLILDHRVAYTSDCTFSRSRMDSLLSQGVSTVFHDVCFCNNSVRGLVHTTFEELSQLPREAAEHIVLMHYPDSLNDENRKRALDLGFRFAVRDARFDF